MRKILILFLALLAGVSLNACKDDDMDGLMAPAADFNFTPLKPVEGVKMLFYADPTEGSEKITEWHWSFGDGKNSTSNKRNPYFTYESPGTYEVVLTVKNAGGATTRVTKSVTVNKIPKFNYTKVWEFSNSTPVTKLNEGSSSPVIGDDGTVYYVEGQGNPVANSKVVAVTDLGATAQLKWATAVGNYIANAPSIGTDGSIYINTWDNTKSLYKLNGTDGSVMWMRGGSGLLGASNTTPAVDAQGNIYHGSRYTSPNGGFFSWTPGGDKRWQIVGVGSFFSSPVLSKDEATVYVYNATEGKLWAVNTTDGSRKWTESVGVGTAVHGTSLSMGADGTIYYTTNTHVVAITDNGATGAVKWSTAVTGAAQSGVVIGANGDLYTGSTLGLVCLNPADGTIRWTYAMSSNESVPAVDKEGRIYLGSTNGKLVVVNEEGILVSEIPLGDGNVNSPTITSNGTVYVEGVSGANIKLYKIAVEDSGPANSFWPMKGRNVKNTSQSK
ncbi:PQQ-binding-like beta-propeller repeat protein [Rufibacter quisquiliarum]|uniref:Outer membrane protein assembly factor BamB n=1 Tax=Rufibacter quisquiliarum TaxID=1549639 RepID=A0A839GH07_9BACT|nr:PQQ-binding-like beta-propeller repeat protein [Rufibacter quisquiliarum]MBA9076883.1 outer membrane protein assembly factor BamB [Rufibacter quisquiliarum]